MDPLEEDWNGPSPTPAPLPPCLTPVALALQFGGEGGGGEEEGIVIVEAVVFVGVRGGREELVWTPTLLT